MFRLRSAAVLFAFVLAFAPAVLRAAGETPPSLAALQLVPTFESIGVDVGVAGALDGLTAELAFRAAGESGWRPALAPVACPAEHAFRGSVLEVASDTRYEVRVRLRGGDAVVAERTAITRTWSDDVPVAREFVLPAGATAQPLVITAQGTPEAWIRYRAAPAGSTIDAGTAAPSAVVLDHAAYVMVEGLVVRGGTQHAVHVVDSHDVRIRGCDIAGWGDPGKWGFYRDRKRQQWSYLDAAGKIIDRQAGIRIRGAGSTRVVIEWNVIHNPRGTASCWAFEHPHGPSGIVLSETGGNNLVRFNDVIAGDGHRFNDAIESEYNGQVNGGPYRDTDIYGNLLAGANDDGTELDGGQINVRFWGNWIEGGLCSVSCAPNLRGPSYVFRNLIVSGDERGACGAGFKMGGDPGVTFLLNNTVYVGNYGLTSGHYGRNPSQIFSRNNLFTGPAPGQGRVRFDAAVAGDLDDDVIPPGGLVGTDAPGAGREAGALFANPEFVDAAARDFRLAHGSAGASAGVRVAGVAAGKSPAGALQDGDVAWPRRPGAPEISPARQVVRLRVDAQQEVAWRLAGASVTSAWRAWAGAPWLTCTIEGRGKNARLVGRVDARALAVGTHRTFVGVRAANGRQRCTLLVVEVEPVAPTTWVFAPETAARTTPAAGFEIVPASDAIGGAFVRAATAGAADGLEFDFETKRAGEFFVLARARATGPAAKIGTQDSLNLRIDDGPTLVWDLFNLSDGTWKWIEAHPKAFVSGRIPLAPGRHRLRLAVREPLLELDALVVSENPFARAPR